MTKPSVSPQTKGSDQNVRICGDILSIYDDAKTIATYSPNAATLIAFTTSSLRPICIITGENVDDECANLIGAELTTMQITVFTAYDFTVWRLISVQSSDQRPPTSFPNRNDYPTSIKRVYDQHTPTVNLRNNPLRLSLYPVLHCREVCAFC